MPRPILPRICIATSIVLTACGPSAPPPLAPSSTEGERLVMLLRPGPATWFPDDEERGAGIDYELAQRFAKERGVTLKIVAAANPEQQIIGGAHAAMLAGGGTYLPAASAPAIADAPLHSLPYHSVYPVLIYNIDGYKPESWNDLTGESVAMLRDSGLVRQLASVREAHGEVDWQLLALPSTEALISQVSDGTLSYAVVASNEADAVRNIYLSFDVAFPVGPRLELSWLFPPSQRQLRDQVNQFFAQALKDGTMQRLVERYFTHVPVPRIDAGAFHERIRAALPGLRAHFEAAQEASGIEWRLIAAVAYQESKWDAEATSETGVRGLMQLTEETARRLRVGDRLDPRASAIAAASYLRELKARLPARIAEPDRTWLALAAYNIGIAHLEDARILAQKQKLSPDLWTAVKRALPLLALPEYYEDAKFGYARGGMPVAFVDRVRAYYGILLAQQPPHQPRLKVLRADVDAPPRVASAEAPGAK